MIGTGLDHELQTNLKDSLLHPGIYLALYLSLPVECGSCRLKAIISTKFWTHLSLKHNERLSHLAHITFMLSSYFLFVSLIIFWPIIFLPCSS